MRDFFIGVLVTAALIAPLCISLLAFPQPSYVGELTLTGDAVLACPADEATLQLGVVTREEEAARALENNSRALHQVIQKLVQAGLSREEYHTGHLSLHPYYSERPVYSTEEWHPTLLGYEVRNKLIIKTQQLQKLGSWVDIAIQQGVNTIDDITFSLHDRDELEREVLVAATEDAMAKAKGILAVSGSRLYRVKSLTVNSFDNIYPVQPMMARASFSNETTPVAAGDVEVRASIKAVIEFVPEDQEFTK